MKKFCILPFVSLSHTPAGDARLCCGSRPSKLNLEKYSISEVWNSDYMAEIRKKMLAGEEVEECRSCYFEEGNGVKSRRLVRNELWEKRGIKDSLDYENPKLLELDLKPGNICNLSCRMCSPDSSSSLEREGIIDRRFKKSDSSWVNSTEYWDEIYSTVGNLTHIYFTGGEPFINNKVRDFVRRIVEEGRAPSINIKFYSNFTHINSEMINLLNEFKSIDAGISIEGVGRVNDYIRFPSKWNDVEKAFCGFLQTIDASKCIVNINTTIQILNILSLDSLINWFNEIKNEYNTIKFNYHFTPVHYPPYYSIRNLSDEKKEQVLADVELFSQNTISDDIKSELDKVKKFLKSKQSVSPFSETGFYKINQLLDKKREQSIEDSLPKLAKLLYK